jgi:hypothetical protein
MRTRRVSVALIFPARKRFAVFSLSLARAVSCDLLDY